MNDQSDTVTEVIDGRMSVYGDPVVEMPNVAKVWSGITGAEITAEMVPLMLIGYKLVRARRAPDYSDNSDDVEGYLDIFRKVVGADMIHARSVSEYLAEVERRQRVERQQTQHRRPAYSCPACHPERQTPACSDCAEAGNTGCVCSGSIGQDGDNDPDRTTDLSGDPVPAPMLSVMYAELPLPGFEHVYDSGREVARQAAGLG